MFLSSRRVSILFLAFIIGFMHCVIGSGPAGVACARALLARGARVLMLDAGIELEPERADLVRQLASVEPSAWPPEEVAVLKGAMNGSAERIPQKLIFGSDYPYRGADDHVARRESGARVRPSLALGGFSAVWGAAMLPFRDRDIEGWPVKSDALAPHYRAVAHITALAARHDDLEECFPLYSENPGLLRTSSQAERLLRNLQRHRESLRESGWRFGRARLALRAADSPSGRGCVHCRMCLYGCPYGCIYNSADTVAEMRADTNFTYQRDVIVRRLRETSETVVITGYHRLTRQALSFEAGRVYLAAGIVPTTQILLRSRGAYDRSLVARDSQYFIFPLVSWRRAREARAEAAYTLSQLFIEIARPQIAPRPVHLQIYGFNDIVAQAVRKSLGPLKLLAPPLEERVLIAQGYLHSDDSPEIEMTLKRDGENDYLTVQSKGAAEARRTVGRVLAEFRRNAWRLGAWPVAPALQLMQPGAGFHTGGTFPMRAQPREFESDVLGRVSGWSRVHAVDASVLPSVPATTITFPVMANAHRIGWETAQLK